MSLRKACLWSLRVPFVFCAVVLLLDGCNSSSSAQDPNLPIAVNISPATASLQAGTGTQTFSATLQNDVQSKGVTWSLSGSGCSGATCGSLSNSTSTSVKYTAPTAVPSPATVMLTATSVADTTKQATATVTITNPDLPIAVNISPATASLQAGTGTQTFSATLQNDVQSKGVTWSLSGSGCSGATCGSLSNSTSTSVKYTAPTAVPSPATVTLTATSVADTTKQATATVTITNPNLPIAVNISPATASLQAGTGTQTFSATLQNDVQSKGVTWSLSGSGCSGATCGSLSNSTSTSVKYTAPTAVPSPATVMLNATSVADTTKQATATITITNPDLPIAVNISPATASLQAGTGTQTFSATLQNDVQSKGVTWSLSGSGCSGATCGSLSNSTSTSVKYTAPTAVPSPATVTLTATSVADTTKQATTTITITAPISSSIIISVSPTRAALTVGQTFASLSGTVTNDSSNQGVAWSISPAGATFSPSTSASGANVTLTAPATAGVYTVTATSVADATRSATMTVAVTDLPGVYTYHNNLARDGANTQEYALTPTLVGSSAFGKLSSCHTDGAIYAQPLWVANLTVNGAKHNVVFVATQHDSLYAFDADANPCVQLLYANLIDSNHGGTSGETSVPDSLVQIVGVGGSDISPEIGVTGTPVIDPSTNTLYVVTKSSNSGGTVFQRLHGIDITTGNEKFGGPADITSNITYPGTGDGGTTVSFSTHYQNQRAGLALVNGAVYVAWASHGDILPYYGWIVAFDASSLAVKHVLNVSPNVQYGGIWMSGGAPAADTNNNLYLITSNADFDVTNTSGPNNDYGDSFLQLSPSLAINTYFTPSDQATDNAIDHDFGSGGATVIVNEASGSLNPLVVGGGKDGTLYLLNGDKMGGLGDSNALQLFNIGSNIFATGAFWNNRYYIAGRGALVSYSFDSSAIASQSTTIYGFPGASPSVSATGTSSNGIVWALANAAYCTSESKSCGPTVLHAYDATNLANELWNSSVSSSDAAGYAVKFTVPTVANGKVYVGTRGNNVGGSDGSTSVPGELDVYGLKPN